MCVYIYIYIYITRLALNEIFSPSNKIYREVGPVKTEEMSCIAARTEVKIETEMLILNVYLVTLMLRP